MTICRAILALAFLLILHNFNYLSPNKRHSFQILEVQWIPPNDLVDLRAISLYLDEDYLNHGATKC